METFIVSGRPVVVDSEDAHLLIEHNWYLNGDGYVARHDRLRTPEIVLLHREILGVPAGVEVDHRSGKTLDNRRGNLRRCTHAQNMQNRKKPKHNTSGFKGVWRRGGKWRSEIKAFGRRYIVGTFDTPEAAAAAYREAAKRYHGEFARSA